MVTGAQGGDRSRSGDKRVTMMDAASAGLDRPTTEAIDWIVRLSSGTATHADADAFSRWRADDAANEAAFRRMAALRPAARAVATEPRMSRRAALGSIAVLVGGGMAAINPPSDLWPSLAELLADHRTGTGERYRFSPIAAVQVEMNTRTSVSLGEADTRLDLIRGEVFVSAPRSAAFRIAADPLVIDEIAGELNVQRLTDTVQLTCVSGTVACTHGDRRTRLNAQEELMLDGDGAVRRRKVPPNQLASWRQGRLVFSDTPLSEVVDQFNRYRSGRIMTMGKAGDRLVSGVFYTERTDDALVQLTNLLQLRTRSLPGGITILS